MRRHAVQQKIQLVALQALHKGLEDAITLGEHYRLTPKEVVMAIQWANKFPSSAAKTSRFSGKN